MAQKLIDQPGVADLVAKHVDKELKKQAAEQVKAVKAVTAQHIDFHTTAGAKDMARAVKLHGAEVVTALKTPVAA